MSPEVILNSVATIRWASGEQRQLVLPVAGIRYRMGGAGVVTDQQVVLLRQRRMEGKTQQTSAAMACSRARPPAGWKYRRPPTTPKRRLRPGWWGHWCWSCRIFPHCYCGMGASAGMRPSWRSSCHSATGMGCAIIWKFSSASATDCGPGITAATAE